MPRSPIRAPKRSLDLSQHLLVFRSAPGTDQADARGPSQPAPAEIVADVPATLTSQTLFGNDRPLEVEVGSGKGLFLTREAKRNGEHNFLGVEIIHKYAKHSAARLAKAQLENAKMISGNAEPLFSDRIPAGSLEAVHVYFPDPWWKKRHRKRRVVNERSVLNFLRALREGGRLHFWTDVLDYFESTIEMIAEIAPQFGVPIPEEMSQATHDLDYRTHFERRSRKNQIPVYRVRYEKRG
ncbi:tRNA (guanosine(46)-N7)-methyltransferase TrmB [Roseiconus nitratireducens]|uniref:tRNA (guanine-N(7)-)-methyltransferase n=1 Tax=Roseiconus nitratireducens TaxID=2605748 RepID=A0A5M6CX20_9BACT|nr:tRNA (guanosine(46)-N7)-methyltransferase TrmB [Roseiconus nitratireducens]KAA5538532.1 tRNA (guanosine(46)-N7)-methyltransferase TrmB [Roseiconus nitratireducens]